MCPHTSQKLEPVDVWVLRSACIPSKTGRWAATWWAAVETKTCVFLFESHYTSVGPVVRNVLGFVWSWWTMYWDGHVACHRKQKGQHNPDLHHSIKKRAGRFLWGPDPTFHSGLTELDPAGGRWRPEGPDSCCPRSRRGLDVAQPGSAGTWAATQHRALNPASQISTVSA